MLNCNQLISQEVDHVVMQCVNSVVEFVGGGVIQNQLISQEEDGVVMQSVNSVVEVVDGGVFQDLS